MQQVGGSVGTALLNTIAATAGATYASTHLSAGHSRPALQLLQANAAIHSYTVSFWWAAGVFLLGAMLSALDAAPGPAVARPGRPRPTSYC